jgi:hypothetical protein
MKAHTSQLAWTQPDWIRQASAWIHAGLEQHGITVLGPIEQPHVRPWSTVLRAATSAGNIYFKATASMLMHETAITQALSRWQPVCSPTLLAADLQRGWMLMADGGKRLREILNVDRDIQHWEKLLPIYAEVQIELVSRLRILLELGMPDRRLATLPEQYARLLDDRRALRINRPGGLTQGEYQRLRDYQSPFSGLCEQLLGYRIPESIHHGDFHDGNVFLNNGRYVFFDWGDSCIAHPFFSLRTVFVSVENTLQLTEDAPDFARLRDAYLEPWTRYESREHLLAACKLAQRLSPVCSALGWYRVISSLDESLGHDYAGAIPGLFQEFLSMEVKNLG